METICSSETSVLIRATRRDIPEECILHSHCRRNLKSYKLYVHYKDKSVNGIWRNSHDSGYSTSKQPHINKTELFMLGQVVNILQSSSCILRCHRNNNFIWRYPLWQCQTRFVSSDQNIIHLFSGRETNSCPDDGSSMIIRNPGKCLSECEASHSRK
jgi:hypothetical protein